MSAVNESKRPCQQPKPYQTVTGFVIIAVHMFAYLVITYVQSVKSYHLLDVDIVVEVMLVML